MMRHSHAHFSIKHLSLPSIENPHFETLLLPAFLPLEDHDASSLSYTMMQEGASSALISEALHLFNGMCACRSYANHYARQIGRERQARAYQLSACDLEARLRLLLHDAFPPYAIKAA